MDKFSGASGRSNLALVVLLSAWFLGGATRFDVLAPVAPTVVGLVAAAIALSDPTRPRLTAFERICLAGLLVFPWLQLVPLPPALWHHLPLHAYPRSVLGAVGADPWLAWSVTPSRTLSSAFAFVPAFAVYLCVRGLPRREADRLLVWLVGFACLSVLIGAAQIMGGSDSAFRFYAITNRDAATGFFSNANHFGSFIAVCVPVALYLGLGLGDRRGLAIGALAGLGGVELLLTAGAISSFSRAGYLFAALGLLVVGAILVTRSRISAKAKLATGAASALFLTLFSMFVVGTAAFRRIADVSDAEGYGRVELVPTFFRMARAAFPTGSGLGSFDATFRAWEDYVHAPVSYLNNAHNDLAQIAIETGAVGLALVGAWLVLIARAGVALWTDRARLDAGEESTTKAIALSFGIMVLLAHSLVDYPLRGACVSATFALLLAQVWGAGRRQRNS